MTDRPAIHPKRTGSGWGWYIAAGVCAGLAMFLTVVSTHDASALGAAVAFWSTSGGLFLIGLAVRLAGKIEERLIDIERKVALGLIDKEKSQAT